MGKKGSLTRELTLAAKVSRRRKSESEQAYLNRIVLDLGGLSDKGTGEFLTRGSGLSPTLERMYGVGGRPSIAPEKLLRR